MVAIGQQEGGDLSAADVLRQSSGGRSEEANACWGTSQRNVDLLLCRILGRRHRNVLRQRRRHPTAGKLSLLLALKGQICGANNPDGNFQFHAETLRGGLVQEVSVV